MNPTVILTTTQPADLLTSKRNVIALIRSIRS